MAGGLARGGEAGWGERTWNRGGLELCGARGLGWGGAGVLWYSTPLPSSALPRFRRGSLLRRWRVASSPQGQRGWGWQGLPALRTV